MDVTMQAFDIQELSQMLKLSRKFVL